MSTTLTLADVERIAALAQLELTADEKQVFTRQLGDILAYAEQLQSIDTSGIAAASVLRAADAGVDIVDLALAAMSGSTSQPNLNSIVAALRHHYVKKNDILRRML